MTALAYSLQSSPIRRRAAAAAIAAVAVFMSLPGSPVAAQAPAGKPGQGVPVALVIANSAYTAQPKLPTCEMSANLVASVLSRAGFKVLRQTNPSNARLGTAIDSLGEELAAAPGGRSLIYLCGYAVTYSDRLFLVPAEARLERDADVLSQGIVARLLMSSVAGPGSEAGLVMMDVAPPPGRGGLDFASMLRPGDAAHGGLAAASLPATESQGPAPMASALADMAGRPLEVGAMLAALQAQPGLARSLLVVRPPTERSWLLGGPPAATEPQGLVPGAAATSAPATSPPATPPPATPPPAAPPPATSVAAGTPPALAEPNAAERRRIQLALRQLGYFKGRVTGAFGPDSLAAIRQFQRDSNAEATGRLTARQAEQLVQ